MSGPIPLYAENGRYRGPNTRKVELWWNLDPHRYVSAISFRSAPPSPRPAKDGLAFEVGETHPFGECRFRIEFTVPNVDAGTYPLVAIDYGRGSAASLKPMHFRVTP